jgi:hypothetical protein
MPPVTAQVMIVGLIVFLASLLTKLDSIEGRKLARSITSEVIETAAQILAPDSSATRYAREGIEMQTMPLHS